MVREWPPTKAEFNPRLVADPIHGNISIFHPIGLLIDTREFQRLRDLKQLGLTAWVYPSGTHNRFTHSLGTYHLAFRLVDSLRRADPSWNITGEDHLCICVAALLHDLGHGPFSHLFDGAFRDQMGAKMPKHEAISVQLIRRIFAQSFIKSAFAPYLGTGAMFDLNVQFISELVSSKRFDKEDNWLPLGRGLEKSFLYDVVSNDTDGTDVDKFDYLLRDSISTGVGIAFNRNSLDRLIENAWIGADECRPHHKRIAWFDKVQTTLEEVGQGRQELHDRLYQHKAVRGIEAMVVRAMQLASPYLLFRGDDTNMYPLARAWEDMGAFLKTNDSIWDKMRDDERPEMTEARELIEKIERREIPRKLDEEPYSPFKADSLLMTNTVEAGEGDDDEISHRLVENLVKEELLKRLKDQEIEEDDIILVTRILHRGMGRVNPMERVLLIDPNQNARPMNKDWIRLKSAESAEIRWLGVYVPREIDGSRADLIKTAFDQVLVDFGIRSQSRHSPYSSQASAQ